PSVVEQLAQLHDELRLDPDVVIDSRREHSLRAARVVDGRIDPIAGARARAIVEHCGLGDLTFRIHPHYTDFFDARLSRPAVRPVALAAMASAGGVVAIICDSADLDIVEMARVAYVPATMPC